jgi:PASTA domain-containing protein
MITTPPLTDVSPGDPITSEGWNNILAAIELVVDFLNKQRGTLIVQVKNQADGNPIRTALVTVKPTGDTSRPTRTALFAAGDVNAYQVDQLLPGSYDVLAEADGFTLETRPITMPDTGDSLNVSIDMAVAEARFAVPNLFGQPLNQGLADLTGQGFTIGRIIDSHGTDIAPGAIPTEAQTASVLGQWPPAGAPVPKSTPIFLNVSAKAEYLQRVKVPDVRGLSLEEAKALLEASGLALGDTSSIGT